MQTLGSTVPGTSDRECLESWARHRDADSLQTLVERYLGFVHSSALRRTGDAAQAAEVTRAVFLVLARRARRLPKNTVLAGWLFHVTAVACRKLKRMGRLRRLWQWISRQPRPALPPDATLWTRLAPQIDRALERLRTKQRNEWEILMAKKKNSLHDPALKEARAKLIQDHCTLKKRVYVDGLLSFRQPQTYGDVVEANLMHMELASQPKRLSISSRR